MTCTLPGGPALGTARIGEIELPVSGAQVVTTAQVVVLVPVSLLLADPRTPGSAQPYSCILSGYSPAVGWGQFGTNAVNPSLRATWANGPAQQQGMGLIALSGSFNW